MEYIVVGSEGVTNAAVDHFDRVLAVTPDLNAAPFQARMHWKPEQSAAACKVCTKGFGFFRRRNHCRQCGEVVCSSCSPHRLDTFIPGCNTVSQVRVCETCKVNRDAPGFSWHRELASFFGTDAARCGAEMMAAAATTQQRILQHQSLEPTPLAQQQSAVVRAELSDTFVPDLGDSFVPVVYTSPPQPAFSVYRHNELGAECPICQAGLADLAAVEFTLPQNADPLYSLGTDPNAVVTINNCGHQFHAACAGKWLKDHSTCPMCRENAFRRN